MRVAVVGHVEWVDFLVVERCRRPARSFRRRKRGRRRREAAPTPRCSCASSPAARLLITALGGDELGRRAFDELSGRGVRVEAVWRDEPQRRAVCFLDEGGERTIALLGPKLVPHGSDPLPWHELEGVDGVYFTGGDVDAVRAARQAKVLVASARELPVLREAGVELDVLVASAADRGGALRRRARARRRGTSYAPKELAAARSSPAAASRPARFRGRSSTRTAPAMPSPRASRTALAGGMPIEKALELASRCGAAVLAGRGPYEGQIDALKGSQGCAAAWSGLKWGEVDQR